MNNHSSIYITLLFLTECFYKLNKHISAGFYITASNLKQYQYDIFNRWGQQIYHTTHLNDQWYNRVGGNLVDAGAYVVKIRYKGTDGK